jgi:pimeloyl-ACP methyl ester carboxylesterase
MAERRTGVLSAGIVSALIGGGYGAIKLFAASDRKRAGVDRERMTRAMEELAEPIGTRHHMFPAHDGGQLHVVEYGAADGKPIVLLHGVTLAATLYNHALIDLGDEFRVFAMDWRGHGRSKPGRDGYGLDVLARDLATMLTHFDLHNATVLGHSMGGMGLGRFCADQVPTMNERVDKLVFCSTAAFDVGRAGSAAMRRFVTLFGTRQPELTGKIAQAAKGDLAYLASRANFGDDPDPVAVEQTRLMFDAMSPVAISKSLLPLFDHDVRKALPLVKQKSLVIVGSEDPLTPPRQADDFMKLLPNATLHTFPGCGHLPMLERRQGFADLVGGFARS